MHQGLAIWMKGEVGLAGPAPVTKDCSISVKPFIQTEKGERWGGIWEGGRMLSGWHSLPRGAEMAENRHTDLRAATLGSPKQGQF